MKYFPHLLKFVPYSDPVLRKVMEPVKFPLSKEEQQLIADMKYSIQRKQLKKVKAAWDSAAGMAANQWGINKRIFLYCPGADMDNPEVIINPSYEPVGSLVAIEPQQSEEFESCFSVPLAVGLVRRYNHIRATYQNEKGETIVLMLDGYLARVWQHETDHLNGLLYDDSHAGKCLFKKEFGSKAMVDAFYSEF